MNSSENTAVLPTVRINTNRWAHLHLLATASVYRHRPVLRFAAISRRAHVVREVRWAMTVLAAEVEAARIRRHLRNTGDAR